MIAASIMLVGCILAKLLMVKYEITTGNIRVENISASALDLSVTTGKENVLGVTSRDDITVGVLTCKVYLTAISRKSIISSGT